MLIHRFGTLDDLPHIERLAASSPAGVTALPAERERLAQLIEASLASLAEEVTFSGEEHYFFVLEDTVQQRLVGCSSIIAAAGFSQPFYTFRNEMFLHASRELGLNNRIHVLSLCHDLTGHSLLAGLHLDPAIRTQADALELNARGRLMFMACHPQRFAESIAAEVAGVSDETGNAPFWDAVGRHFFAVSYVEAEQLSSSRGRHFLAELMPGYPIYVPMLSDAAQEVIGQPHPGSEAVFDLLLREGFQTDDYIDLFDGGPVVHGRTATLRTLAASQTAVVSIGAMRPGARWLVATPRVRDFRAGIIGSHWLPGEPLVLDEQHAAWLGVAEGDSVRICRGGSDAGT